VPVKVLRVPNLGRSGSDGEHYTCHGLDEWLDIPRLAQDDSKVPAVADKIDLSKGRPFLRR
jgi:hypothetical protein